MTVSIPYHTLTGRRLCPSYPPRDPLWTSGVSSNYSAAERQYLHKAHTTIQVTGFDNFHWTAIGLVDTPHEADSVEYYSSSYDKRLSDPLTRGHTLLEQPEADPRLYFLNSWEERIAQAAVELEGVVHTLKQGAERYEFPQTTLHTHMSNFAQTLGARHDARSFISTSPGPQATT